MDTESIIRSVKKTKRLLALQESWLTCSVAAEVAAIAADQLFADLKAPVKRIGNKEAPIPFGRELSNYVHPQVEEIIEKSIQTIKY